MNFDSVYEKIIANKENHNRGYYNCIPFLGLNRLESVIPGIEPRCYYLIGANSGVGKSKLARFLFIHTPLMYLEQNKNEDIKIDIILFSLEESKEKVILSEISRYLFTKYKKMISVKQLQSIGKYNTISVEDLKLVAEAKEHVESFLQNVHIVDSITNPTGLYKYCRDFALKIGTYYDKNNVPLSPEEISNINSGIGNSYQKISYYKTHHPRHFVIIITDNLNLLTSEKGGGQSKEAIDLYSSKYCLRLRDKFNFTVVNVQQFNSEKESLEFNFSGKTIEEKLEPNLSSFGDSRVTPRDSDIVLGLFNPSRYNINQHGGYNISFMRDNYRALKILKSRDGISDVQVPLMFVGQSDFFKELPKIEDEVNIGKMYKYIERLRNG